MSFVESVEDIFRVVQFMMTTLTDIQHVTQEALQDMTIAKTMSQLNHREGTSSYTMSCSAMPEIGEKYIIISPEEKNRNSESTCTVNDSSSTKDVQSSVINMFVDVPIEASVDCEVIKNETEVELDPCKMNSLCESSVSCDTDLDQMQQMGPIVKHEAIENNDVRSANDAQEQNVTSVSNIQGNFIGYTTSTDTDNKYCRLCKDVCHSSRRNRTRITTFRNQKHLHEHIMRYHNVYMCSCMKWSHYYKRKGCYLACNKKHIYQCSQDHPLKRNRKGVQTPFQPNRNYCAVKPKSTTVTVIDKTHKVTQLIDAVPCMCESCV